MARGELNRYMNRPDVPVDRLWDSEGPNVEVSDSIPKSYHRRWRRYSVNGEVLYVAKSVPTGQVEYLVNRDGSLTVARDREGFWDENGDWREGLESLSVDDVEDEDTRSVLKGENPPSGRDEDVTRRELFHLDGIKYGRQRDPLSYRVARKENGKDMDRWRVRDGDIYEVVEQEDIDESPPDEVAYAIHGLMNPSEIEAGIPETYRRFMEGLTRRLEEGPEGDLHLSTGKTLEEKKREVMENLVYSNVEGYSLTKTVNAALDRTNFGLWKNKTLPDCRGVDIRTTKKNISSSASPYQPAAVEIEGNDGDIWYFGEWLDCEKVCGTLHHIGVDPVGIFRNISEEDISDPFVGELLQGDPTPEPVVGEGREWNKFPGGVHGPR